jgi:hypothetical protein
VLVTSDEHARFLAAADQAGVSLSHVDAAAGRSGGEELASLERPPAAERFFLGRWVEVSHDASFRAFFPVDAA